MKISVLIPTWRRPGALERCIDGVERQTRLPDELVLSVRADDDETRAALARRDSPFEMRVVAPGEPGLVAALNAALAAASGDVLALIDDDAVPRPDWLARIEGHFASDARIGGVGGRDWIAHGDRVEDGSADRVGQIRWFGRVVGNHHLGVGAPREVAMLKGANMSYRAAAVEGLAMDPRLRGSGAQHHNDLDFSMAVRARGWRLLYDPAVAVDHYEDVRHGAQREGGMAFGQLRDAVHNQAYALLKSLPPRAAAVATAYGLVVGSREAPGPLLAAERIARGEDPRAVLRRLGAATLGRLLAWVTAARARLERRQRRASPRP